MEKNSYLLDAIRLPLLDIYKVSEIDLRSISDVVLQSGFKSLEDVSVFSQLCCLIEKASLSSPCSYNYLRELWEQEYSILDYVSSLTAMVSNGLLTLKRVTESSFFIDGITKSKFDVQGNYDYVVIYQTGKLKGLLSVILPVLQSSRNNRVLEGFGYSQMNKKYFNLLGKLQSNFDIVYPVSTVIVSLESYTEDVLKSEDEINIKLVSKNIDLTSVSDVGIKRSYSKYLNKNKAVVSYEVYKDSDTDVFLSLILDRKADASDLTVLYSLIVQAYKDSNSK